MIILEILRTSNIDHRKLSAWFPSFRFEHNLPILQPDDENISRAVGSKPCKFPIQLATMTSSDYEPVRAGS